MFPKSIATASLACLASAGLAAGDMPTRLDRSQAAAEYARVRALLSNEGRDCPADQSPMSGLVTGGAAPGAGSRTTTLVFDRGAIVRIVRNWNGTQGASSSTFTVTCDPAPAAVEVPVGATMGNDVRDSFVDGCRRVTKNQRVLPPTNCRMRRSPSSVPRPAM